MTMHLNSRITEHYSLSDTKEADVFMDNSSEKSGPEFKNKEQTKAYLEVVYKKFTEHNIYEKFMKLRESVPTMDI